MSSPHYSLRWNNHQSHLLTAFDTLLQNETLVDVTLVCEETSFKAHKVVLSACSPYFQRIFSETPCKHPVIVLKDLRGWEVQAIVDFMYRGEISVGQEQLSSLIKAAESLQVRGLAHTERIPVMGSGEKEAGAVRERGYSPPAAPPTSPPHHQFNGSGMPPPHHPMRLPQIPHLPNISFNELSDRHCTSPTPRRKQLRKSHPKRKLACHHTHTFCMCRGYSVWGRRWRQARPRRRSGDASIPQDLSKPLRITSPLRTDMAENLSMKKPAPSSTTPSSRQNNTPTPPQINQMKMENEDSDLPDLSQQHPVELTTTPQEPRMDFNPTEPLGLPPPQHESTLENSFPHLASISALSLTPPHMFSLDSQLGLFPGLENCRNPLLNDLSDQRMENHISSKKKLGRPKGQHSAPRGGPPRSWTNAELTEALQHVWNKKMTTSQASRIFGIPYNSLLMYVRGKYGKSLKLEQLKKECFGELGSPLDLLGLGNISNNNNPPPPGKPHKMPEPDHLMLGPPGFNHAYPPVPPSFYPDFGASFPVPVGMVHLLPPSEKNREQSGGAVGGGGGGDTPGVVMDYTKDDDESRHRNSTTPLDFAKDDMRASPMALDFVKEEHERANCTDPDENSNSPRTQQQQPPQRREIPVGQTHNGQD
ncbi:protein jim lovell-like isoform X3 [Rhodnius prolixus]|uniref:protein jim lovell-like isoform X3 n=1 Tax=Rhodnius prolixus TaxID=13249 RepID=UPI003D18C9EB